MSPFLNERSPHYSLRDRRAGWGRGEKTTVQVQNVPRVHAHVGGDCPLPPRMRDNASGLALASLFTGAFHAPRRARAIKQGGQLPPAMRVATELSLWWAIKTTFACTEHLRAACNYRRQYPKRMLNIANSVQAQLKAIYTDKSLQRLIDQITRAVLVHGRGFYGLKCVAERAQAMDFDECCARCDCRPTAHAAPPFA